MTEWFRRWVDLLESEQFPDLEAGEPYDTLADAGEQYRPGKTQIWYSKGTATTFNPRQLDASHAMIGTLAETDPEQVFSLMQSESWDPGNRANDMLAEFGVKHKSMTKGDIIVDGNRFHLVTDSGIKTLGGK